MFTAKQKLCNTSIYYAWLRYVYYDTYSFIFIYYLIIHILHASSMCYSFVNSVVLADVMKPLPLRDRWKYLFIRQGTWSWLKLSLKAEIHLIPMFYMCKKFYTNIIYRST